MTSQVNNCVIPELEWKIPSVKLADNFFFGPLYLKQIYMRSGIVQEAGPNVEEAVCDPRAEVCGPLLYAFALRFTTTSNRRG